MREHASFLRRLREALRADLARMRAGVDDLEGDYGGPPAHAAPTRDELKAFGRHLRTTGRLLGDLSNADSPGWERAHEEHERSWDEMERAPESRR